jgi:hypothetical protein
VTMRVPGGHSRTDRRSGWRRGVQTRCAGLDRPLDAGVGEGFCAGSAACATGSRAMPRRRGARSCCCTRAGPKRRRVANAGTDAVGPGGAVAKVPAAARLERELEAMLREFVRLKTVSSDPQLREDCFRGAKFLASILESLGAWNMEHPIVSFSLVALPFEILVFESRRASMWQQQWGARAALCPVGGRGTR